MKKILCMVLTTLVAFSILAGCESSADSSEAPAKEDVSFETLVKNGDYAKAAELYKEKYAGNSNSENSAKNFLQDYLNEKRSNYAAGNISEQEFVDAYTTLEKLNKELSLINNLDTVFQQYTRIKKSKESYTQAIAFSDNGDLEKAIKAFSQVVKDDIENYDNAQARLKEATAFYLENAITNAEQLASAGNFDEAVAYIRSAEAVIGTVEELENCLSDLHTRKFESSIKSALSASDYLTVIRVYQEASTNSYVKISSDMSAKYSSSQTNYINDVFERAESAFGNNKDYSAAIQALREAISEVSEFDNMIAELEQRIEHYKEYVPIYITSLKCEQQSTFMRFDINEAVDVNGTRYDGSSTFLQSYDNGLEAHVIYNLNFKYTTLTGVLCRPYRTVSHSDFAYERVRIEIYGDDILLYKAPTITKNTYDPIRFAIDVSGVRNLRIVIVHGWDAMPLVYISEVMLQK